mmetsp:Transcript_18105/g.30239  ORF Transcript_18105/g.30239 Transcript_18105/m.30239 type:complete len:263 (-) Transcript_18105:433-1221(-)
MTCLAGVMPSSRVSNCDTTLRSSSPCVLSRFGAIASISSMKRIDGALRSASSNACRNPSSESPGLFAMTSGPFKDLKNTPVSVFTASATIVLPEPAGPCINTPRGGRTPMTLKTSGCFSGRSMSSLSIASCLSSPPTSSYPTVSSSSACSSVRGSPSGKISVALPAMPELSGSISITFHRTTCSLSPTVHGVSTMSPTESGRIASLRNGLSPRSNGSPSNPSRLAASGWSIIRSLSLMSRRVDTITEWPLCTLRFARAVLDI